MMVEIRNNQKESQKLLGIVDSINKDIKRVYDMHNKCNIHEVSAAVDVLKDKVALIFKITGAIGVSLIPIVYKIFGG